MFFFLLASAAASIAGLPSKSEPITADFDQDGRIDKARVSISEAEQTAVVVVDLVSGRSLSLYKEAISSKKAMTLEVRVGGDPRCPNWKVGQDTECGHSHELPHGPYLVVHEAGERDVIFNWTGGRPAEFIAQIGFR